MEKKSYRSEKGKKWFHPDLNRGPSLRESDVITNYTMKPLRGRCKKGSVSKQGVCRESRMEGKWEKKTLPVGLEPTTVRLRAARSTD